MLALQDQHEEPAESPHAGSCRTLDEEQNSSNDSSTQSRGEEKDNSKETTSAKGEAEGTRVAGARSTAGAHKETSKQARTLILCSLQRFHRLSLNWVSHDHLRAQP